MTAPRREVIGDAELWLGDCREVLPTLGRVDAVVTDPPYGIGFDGKAQKSGSGETIKRRATYHSHDDAPELWSRAVLPAIETAVAMSDAAAVFCASDRVGDMPRGHLGALFSPNGAGSSSWGFTCLMPFLLYGRCPYLANGKGRRPTAYEWLYRDHGDGVDHPCPKPVSAMLLVVARVSLPGHSVLDPFMGSGSTGVACARLGRPFVGVEIEPRYFDTALRRIEAAHRQADLFVERPAPRPEQATLALGGAA